jgi:hypothetical protein
VLAFFIVYLGIGIGTALKFYGEYELPLLPWILVVLPINTIIVTCCVIPKVLSKCLKQSKNKIRTFFLCISVCVKMTPLIAGAIGYSAIRNDKKSARGEASKTCVDIASSAVLSH